MTAPLLADAAALFTGHEATREAALGRFRLDLYYPALKLAFEYDGPEHYCEVGHIERDERKGEACERQEITLRRWPYYFQLTRDVAKYMFAGFYSDYKYAQAISLVYGAKDERDVLAPGLHKSKCTPANFVHRGANRFFREIDDAPSSVRSQVIRSFQLYLAHLGPSRGWLLLPEHDSRFRVFMERPPEAEHLNCYFPNLMTT